VADKPNVEAAAEKAAEAAEDAAEAAEEAAEAVELAAPADDPVLDTGARRIEAQVDANNPFGKPGQAISRDHPFVVAFIATLGVATAALLVEAVLVARQVLVLFLVAAFLAVGLDPAVRWLVRRGLRRSVAVDDGPRLARGGRLVRLGVDHAAGRAFVVRDLRIRRTDVAALRTGHRHGVRLRGTS